MKSLGLFGIILLGMWLIVILGRDHVRQAVELYPQLTFGTPYFQPGYALLLYLLTPLVVMSGIILFMWPGLMIILALNRCEGWSEILIQSLAAALVSYVLSTSILKLAFNASLHSRLFIDVVGISGALMWGVMAIRVISGAQIRWPFSRGPDRRRLFWVLMVPYVAIVVLLPIFLWQDLHDDACEALEIGRSLSAHLTPRFPTETGAMGIGVGLLPMAYPVHWFVTLIGPVEAAARFPLLLYLPVLFCLTLQMIEWKSPRKLGFAEEAVLFLAFSIVLVTLGYNASYDPYFADLAAPTAFEIFTALTIAATIYFLWSGQIGWFLFFALVSYLGRPTGLLALGFLACIIFVFFAERRRKLLTYIATAIGICLLVTILYDRIYIPSLIGTADFGYPFGSVLRRIRFLTFDDWSRIGFVLLPVGILPLGAIFAWRWQDSLAWLVSLFSLLSGKGLSDKGQTERGGKKNPP
ncbi:hypothetical protein KFU94_06505 [Chloroflexi bacterium TSY]|nr:hypothetical protein [Chloroflexi bacterium TSY]